MILSCKLLIIEFNIIEFLFTVKLILITGNTVLNRINL